MNHTSTDHPWFQESRSLAGQPQARLVRLVGHLRALPGRPHHLHRHRDVQLDLGRGGGRLLLAPLLQPPARPQLRRARPSRRRCSTSCASGCDLGLDGFRLDAVPYLYEREGTNCENLAETHEFLKRVRQTIDTEYPDRVLLAEANQWPEDVVRVLRRRGRVPHGLPLPGHAAHVHVAAPRGGRRRSTRSSSARRTSPTNCQWGLFLRNHDELTLEMVTDEERDYMYAEYAKDPRMKINVGHPPPPGAAARQRPRRDGAAARDPLLPAGQPGPLLRGRDRDGRQRLPRRPRRRPHADAVDGRSQRRLLPRRLRRSSTRRR